MVILEPKYKTYPFVTEIFFVVEIFTQHFHNLYAAFRKNKLKY